MINHRQLSLIDCLRGCAGLWTAATGRSLGALSTIVMNHGSFFERFESPRASTTTATLEKFASYLADPAAWPDGAVPVEVHEFVRRVRGGAGCVDFATNDVDRHQESISVHGGNHG